MLRFVHVPKTGGVALREALAPLGLGFACDGHLTTLASAQEENIITIVRDPMDRYVSAFWWLATKTLWPWPSPDAMACRMGTTLVDNAFKRYMVLWRQTHWIDCERPFYWIGHTESLSDDAARLGALLGLTVDIPRRNVGRYPPSPLSERALANLHDFYADDYELLRGASWLSK